MRVRLGIVGAGSAGAMMLAAAQRHRDIEVVAVADPRVASLPLAHGIARYDSIEAMAATERLHAVHVASPTPLHADHVRAAVSANWRVAVEKPAAESAAAVRALAASLGSRRDWIVVGHSEGFERHVAAAAALVASGRIGALELVVAGKVTEWMRRPRLAEELDREKGGGLLRRQGVHQVDVLRVVAGHLRSRAGADGRAAPHGHPGLLTAVAATDPGRGGIGTYLAWLDLGGGVVGVMGHDGTGALAGSRAHGPMIGPDGDAEQAEQAEQAAKHARSDVLLETLATGGSVRLGADDLGAVVAAGTAGRVVATPAEVRVVTAAGIEPVPLAGLADGRRAVLDELAAVVAGRTPLRDLEWGAGNLQVCEEIDRAVASRRRLNRQEL